ncbi:MAG: DUF1572 domain-containing protein, partial [Gemmatimonadota bacterium]|nr:DUF1572 domain-containing protein [Gemmatimonadota bacterium]
ETQVTVELAREFVARSRYYLMDEYRTKLRRAVKAIPADAIWQRANDGSNSVGNLLLHLAGNVGQWIVSGVGGAIDTRDRPAEFNTRRGGTADELLAALDGVLSEADAVLEGLSADTLVERRTIQGRHVSVMAAVYSAVQHFSTHLGQIIMVAKEYSPGAIQFYEDTPDGKARPIWKE